MNHKIVETLRPHVTTFSGAICKNNKHGDEIVVGGEIVNILDFPAMFEDEKKMVQIDIDDAVGIISLLLPGMAYKAYQDEHDFTLGDMILATGKVYRPEGIKEECYIPTIVCWLMAPLK